MPCDSALRPHPQEASQQGGAPPHQEKNAAASFSLFLSKKGAHFSLLPSLHVATLGQEGKFTFQRAFKAYVQAKEPSKLALGGASLLLVETGHNHAILTFA